VKHKGSGKLYFMKQIHDIKEAKRSLAVGMVMQISHPNLVKYESFFQDGEICFGIYLFNWN
jgi:hypothetical protein